MQSLYVLPYFLIAMLLGPALGVLGSPYQPDAPALVIASPLSGGTEAVVTRAGGWLVGPRQPLVGRLATGPGPDFEQRLRRAGAWLVLDGARFTSYCGEA